MLDIIQDTLSGVDDPFPLQVASEPSRLKRWQISDHTQVKQLAQGVYLFSPLTSNLSTTKTTGTRQVVLSCGIHGDETAPIELLQALVFAIFNQEFQLKQALLVVVGNPKAIALQRREVEFNLNRLFSLRSQPVEALEVERAEQLKACLAEFYQTSTASDNLPERVHLDLHCSIRPSEYPLFAVMPVNQDANYRYLLTQFAEQAGMQAIVYSNKASSTFSYYSSAKYNAYALTLELGKLAKFGQNELSQFALLRQQFISLLCSEKPLQALYQQTANNINCFAVKQSIFKHSHDFKLNFTDDIANFSEFNRDELLAAEDEINYPVVADKEYVLFPNAAVALGQRALLTLTRVKLT